MQSKHESENKRRTIQKSSTPDDLSNQIQPKKSSNFVKSNLNLCPEEKNVVKAKTNHMKGPHSTLLTELFG